MHRTKCMNPYCRASIPKSPNHRFGDKYFCNDYCKKEYDENKKQTGTTLHFHHSRVFLQAAKDAGRENRLPWKSPAVRQ